MEQRTEIEVGQFIKVDSDDAFISMIYHGQTNKIEVVYLQHGFKPIFTDAYWENGQWHFASPPPHGGYADGVPRLRRYVEALQALHLPKKPRATKKEPYQRGRSIRSSRPFRGR